MAKASDPDLGRARSRYLGSQADTELARSALRPRVNADVGLSYIDQTSITRGTPSLQSTVLGFNYDVVASAPLLHFSSRFNLASAKAAERGEEAGVTATRQGLILRLTQAYFGLLKTQGDDVIARDEISRVKQALEQAQAFLQAGTGDIIAVYEAQARLDSVLADLNRSESSLTACMSCSDNNNIVFSGEIFQTSSYFPIQNREKISSRRDSWTLCPVISET